MHHDCPICFEYLFESRNDVTVLPCGHTIHQKCLEEMREHYQYACPLCSKSVCDMSKVWEKFDMEIAATPMPEPYQNRMVQILCNDCGTKSEVQYHVVAQKCPNCKSYNTRQTRGWSWLFVNMAFSSLRIKEQFTWANCVIGSLIWGPISRVILFLVSC
jgi:RING finger/CHY zinc finger protein 1